VNWASGAKFMQVEIDMGSGFVDIGTQQLLSVPYALHSGSAETANNGFSSVSSAGDTLYLANGNFLIIPGISEANNNGGTSTGTTLHTCGAVNVHNPNLTYGSMIDQEGNAYKTIVIGTQEWMAENLNTSIYRNGDAIPTDLSNTEWAATQLGAWTYYNDDMSNECPHGKLYNWFTCVDDRQLCPTNWRIPTNEEWIQLTTHLGGAEISGGKMKSTGTLETSNGWWFEPNTSADNISGFSGTSAGYRLNDGFYANLGYTSYWWSSSEFNTEDALHHFLLSYSPSTGSNNSMKQHGFSVRCLRD
jgi:uncharacterized protein (TIGR02145 family)